MSAEAQGLQIPVGFTLDEARAELRALEAESRRAGTAIGSNLDPTKGPARGLSGLKENLSRSREAAMFFTQSLGEFGPSGRTAQFAISGIAGAVLGGGGLLLALEGARVLMRLTIGAWSDATEQAKKLADEATKLADSLAAAETRRKVLLAESRGDQAGAARAQTEGDVTKLARDIAAMQAELEAKTAELAQKRGAFFRFLPAEENLAAEIANLKTKLEAAHLELGNTVLSGETRMTQIRTTEAEKRTNALDAEAKKALEIAQKRFDADNAMQVQQDAHVRAYYEQRAAQDARYEEYAREAQRRMNEFADQEFMRNLERQEFAMRRFAEMGKASLTSLGQAMVSELGKGLRTSRAYEQAMREAGATTQSASDLSAAAIAAMVQDTLASFAEQSAVEALIETARGFAALARNDGKGASQHFTSAGMFVAAAAAAGLAAHVIGQTRGMTGAERASVDAAREQGASRESGPRELGASPERGSGNVYNVFFTGRALVTEPEVKRYLADLMEETRESGW